MTKLNPLFGGWTPTYEGDPCKGGHPPQAVRDAACGRCGRALDQRRCLCGEPSHRGGLSRSMCPTRMRHDQRDAEEHLPRLNGVIQRLGAAVDLMTTLAIWIPTAPDEQLPVDGVAP